MSSSKTCPDCGEVGSFEFVSNGSDEMNVCGNCGFFDAKASQEFLTGNDVDLEASNYVHYDGVLKLNKNGVSRGMDKAKAVQLKYVFDSVSTLQLPTTVKRSAMDMLERCCSAWRMSKAVSLGCVFLACDTNQSHIPLRDFCKHLECDRFQIAKAKVWISHILQLHQNQEETLESLIVTRLKERNLPIVLEAKIKTLMNLLRKGWVSSGHSDEMFLWPALFVIQKYEAKKPGKFHQTSFFKRHKIADLISYATLSDHVRLVVDFLTTLTNHVPWLSSQQKGKEESVARSFSWMMEHAEFMMEKIEMANEAEGGHVFEPGAIKRKAADVEEVEGPDRKKVFVPEGDIGDQDIKDDDFSEYIRTPSEVAEIQKLQEEQPP